MRQGATQNSLTPLEPIPAEFLVNNGKSLGNPVIELATSNGTTPHATTGGTPATQWLINLSEGTNKNDLGVLGHFRTPGRLDEKRNSHKSGRTDRNWSEVFRKYKLQKKND